MFHHLLFLDPGHILFKNIFHFYIYILFSNFFSNHTIQQYGQPQPDISNL
jgi:hypothetical protein